MLNTADIGDFCIVGMKSVGSGTRSLRAVTGDCATSARQEGYHVAERVAALHAEVESACTSHVCGISDIVSDTYHKYVVYAVTLLSLCVGSL